MRKAILSSNIIIFISAFLLFFLVVFLLFYQQNKKNQSHYMNVIMNEVELAFINYDESKANFVLTFKGEHKRRLTILNEAGIVLADSHDEEIGSNKSHRPEIQNPNQVYVRKSATLSEDMMYLSRLVLKSNEYYYLRIAVFVEPGLAPYQALFLIFFAIALGLVLVHLVVIKKVSDKLLLPWQQVKSNMKMLRNGEYKELNLINDPDIDPILKEIHDVNLDILRHIKTIENYQLRLNQILNELKQGVMLFNRQNHLLYFNDDAKKMFELTIDALNKPIYHQIRHLKIRDMIEETNQNHLNLKWDFAINEKTYEVLSFEIESTKYKGDEATVLLVFKDVSYERNIERVKKDFFAHTSHELKSPLTAIKGHSELIELKLLKTETEVIASAKQIGRQTELMNSLVEDMLMLSRLEGMPETAFTKQSITSILQQALENLAAEIAAKEIKLDKNIEMIMFNCDPIDMHKLFKNLIENAVKYSDLKQKIEVKLYKENKNIVFSVKDYGIGIDISHQERIFERFYRIDKGRLEGGTGLGLAIVKHIVLKYKGKIDLRSKLGQGSVFIVKIPISNESIFIKNILA